jgi:hypothetical protein
VKPRKEESKTFFFEKKNQKTFAHWPPGVPRPGANEQKFFAALFFKKARSFFLLRPMRLAR